MRCQVCGALNGKVTRTNQQNKYYWSICVGMLSDHTGFTPEDMHEILKHKFLERHVVVQEKSRDDIIRIPKSTKILTTEEFKVYLEQIKEWASIDLGVVLPDPT